MRGDRPQGRFPANVILEFTPHARGSTLLYSLRPLRRAVYPACAGIDPVQAPAVLIDPGLPRMRGDRPRAQCSGEG